MTAIIPLASLPNQEFTVTLDGDRYNITVKKCTTVMEFSIVRNGVDIILGVAAVPQFPIIPYQYLETGNFFIETANDELPDWEQFGVSQFLIYFSPSEMAEARG